MPDVTPKTESGRLDAAWRELEMDALASDGPIRDSDVKDAIKRNRHSIEREAASAAVAEVLDRLEHRVRANYGTLPTGDVVCALIASERGT